MNIYELLPPEIPSTHEVLEILRLVDMLPVEIQNKIKILYP